MLAFATDLACRLETSTPLGAYGSGLPAGAIFFQRPQQSDVLAAQLAYRCAERVIRRLLRFNDNHSSAACGKLDASFDTETGRFDCGARTCQRPPAIRHLAVRLCGQHHRVAQPAISTA